jgi:hypothetical protein
LPTKPAEPSAPSMTPSSSPSATVNTGRAGYGRGGRGNLLRITSMERARCNDEPVDRRLRHLMPVVLARGHQRRPSSHNKRRTGQLWSGNCASPGTPLYLSRSVPGG